MANAARRHTLSDVSLKDATRVVVVNGINTSPSSKHIQPAGLGACMSIISYQLDAK